MHDATDISLDLLSSHREPLTGTLGDYQSRIFTTQIAINPLIAAAMPLLSTASTLTACQTIDNPEDYIAKLIHEIKAFENHAANNDYRSQHILAARYLLCSLLDEKIKPCIPEASFNQHSLLQSFQHEQWGGERFFVILERSIEEPSSYIDLLELGYICLSLGFQGKYQSQHQVAELGIFIDQLYQVIQQQRGESSQLLNKCTECTITKSKWRLPPWWVVASTSLVLLAAIFIPYTRQLNHAVKPLLYNLNHYKITTNTLSQ